MSLTLPTRASARTAREARRSRHDRRDAEMPRLAPHRTWRDRLALALLMAAAAFIFFWNLTASGYANEFYSAAAQAGSQSWEAFLWGALDSGCAITVDKPPASIWLMALSVRLLGLSSFAILLPQALMGVACTYLLYAIVRRGWGNTAGIVAGAVFITTPVAALMFRFNNPDALLILLMLGASGCVLRGLELPASAWGNRRRTTWFALAGALIGLGFLTKQFQVLLVLPGFAVAMFACSPARWPRRLLDAAVALGCMVLAAGWWIALTVIVPSGSRPYIGGSQTDSFLELTFGYNGLGRLTGDETGSVLPGATYTATGAAGSSAQGGMWGETGLWRLWTRDFGDQITWLAPIAFAGLILGLLPPDKGQVIIGRFLRKQHTRRLGATSRGAHDSMAPAGDDAIRLDDGLGTRQATTSNATRDGAARNPDTVVRMRRAQLAVFGGWLLVTWLVFSFMAGIFHAYYTVALAPAIAALVAVATAVLRERHQAGRAWPLGVAGALIAFTAAWDMALVLRQSSYAALGVGLGVLGVAAGLALCGIAFLRAEILGERPLPHLCRAGARTALVLGCIALIAGPATWTACTIATGHTGSIVTAGPSGSMGVGGPGGMDGGPGTDSEARNGDNGSSDSASGSANPSESASDDVDGGMTGSGQGAGPGGGLLGGAADESLTELLTANATDYRWAAATTGSQNAASYQLASGLPVMAIGGFNGSDPAPTLDEFKAYVAQGLVRYYIAGGGIGGAQMGGSSAASEIQAWVEENFAAQTVGNTTVYDLQAS